MSPIRTFVFPNGFRLIYEKSTNVLPITSVNVFCDVGSVYEEPHLRGASHFIEHMCFKGTKKRPSAKEIFIEYDEIGADFNAFTMKRFTCYVFKCDSKHVNTSIEILGDMMLNSTFIPKEFEREHKVVIEENLNNENDAEDQIYIYNDKLLYVGSSFEHPVDDVSYHKKGSLSRDAVLEFYHKHYRPDNMIFSIVTDVSFDNIKKILLKSFFATVKKEIVTPVGKHVVMYRGLLSSIADIQIIPLNNSIGTKSMLNYSRDWPSQDLTTGQSPVSNLGRFKLVKKRGVENILFTTAFRVCGNDNNDKYRLDILSNMLSGTMSGRIFMALREKTGLIYSSNIDTNYYDAYGDFTIFTQTDADLIIHGAGGNTGKRGLIPMFVALLNDLVKNGVTQRELEITKGFIKGNLLIEMEDINTQCEYNGTQMLMSNDKIIPYADIYKRCYANISVADINNTIQKYIKREHMCVCLLGEKLPSLNTVEKEFSKLRI